MANARMSLLVLSGWIALVAGCQQLPPAAIQQIEQARGELQRRNYDQCEKILNPVIASYQTNNDIAEALYMRGQCRLMKDQRRMGVNDLTTAQHIAREKRLRAWIEVQLANVAFDDGSYPQARELYESALPELPDSPPTDQVMHQLAMACERTGDRTESARVLGELAQKFPTSTYSKKPGQSNTKPRITKPRYRTIVQPRNRTTLTATSPTQPRTSQTGRFEIQCGAYARIEHAHQAAARLRQQGINALAIPESRGAGAKHVVRVGKYNTYREASQALARIRKYHTDAFIVR
ncbi:MAG: SPOR domain-containing protein [Phycisphaerales bacterium]|nr:SPOR domain-containing protein [Phycisphaerales bacterium]